MVGSANVDLTTFSDRFPKAGETIFGEHFDLGWGGKGANQAVAARLCGAEVSMVARVGDDLFGPATIKNFESQGIDASHVRIVAGASSGVAPIFVESNGQNRIIVVKGANDRLLPADVDEAHAGARGRRLHRAAVRDPARDGLPHGAFRPAARHPLHRQPGAGQPVDLAALAGVDYFVPNETEAETITGMPVRSVEDARACATHLVRQGLQRVIITLGEKGALVAHETGRDLIAPYRVATKDTTGAGDAFVGSFAVFLGEGLAERDAIARANLYAALSTMSVGTQKSFVTREQFDGEWRTRAAEGPLVTP